MILDEIVLQDFGLYAGRQSIVLTPPSADKPVILIGGLNGGGKTTLLDALQLCLYGAHARISNRGSIAYQEYLARCIHRGVEPREAVLELKFRHTVEGKVETYRLRRSWRMTPSGCRESFEVIRNGVAEPVLSENWITHVEDLMPPNIAHLFLFDGEQMESYASLTNSANLIGAAIQNLLGLDIVDQLDKDLQVFERRKRIEDRSDDSRAEIEAAEVELRNLRTRSAELTEIRAALRSHTIDHLRKTLAKLDADFRKLGGELFEQRAVIEARRDEADHLLVHSAEVLRELAAGALPLSLVSDQVKAIARQAEKEQLINHGRVLAQALKVRDESLLRQLRVAKVDKKAMETVRQFLADDREKRVEREAAGIVLDLSPTTRNDVGALLHNELPTARADATKGMKEYRDAVARAEHLRTQFDSIPGADIVSNIVAQRDARRMELSKAEAEYAALGTEIERVFRDVERRSLALARLLEEGAKAEGDRQDRSRVLHHSTKVRETLGSFRRAVAARHVRRIEQLVLESFRQLLRKKTLIHRLTIDPETYAVTLYGSDEMVLSPERLSAGERQLLATALLWGLAKASGRPLPTAIDTPLGRLDGEHRANLVERYFPYASHQVVLLSTDEEIAGEYLERLTPWVGRKYRLSYSDERGRTEVVAGYFPVKEVA